MNDRRFPPPPPLPLQDLKYDLMRDKEQWRRNDGCLATQQMLQVVIADGWVDWPGAHVDSPQPPPRAHSQRPPAPHPYPSPDGGSGGGGDGGDGREHELCREETPNAKMRCALALFDGGCSARYIAGGGGGGPEGGMPFVQQPCCIDMAVDMPPVLLEETGCHCSCALYQGILRQPPPPTPYLEGCLNNADLPGGGARHTQPTDQPTDQPSKHPNASSSVCAALGSFFGWSKKQADRFRQDGLGTSMLRKPKARQNANVALFVFSCLLSCRGRYQQ